MLLLGFGLKVVVPKGCRRGCTIGLRVEVPNPKP